MAKRATGNRESASLDSPKGSVTEYLKPLLGSVSWARNGRGGGPSVGPQTHSFSHCHQRCVMPTACQALL